VYWSFGALGVGLVALGHFGRWGSCWSTNTNAFKERRGEQSSAASRQCLRPQSELASPSAPCPLSQTPLRLPSPFSTHINVSL